MPEAYAVQASFDDWLGLIRAEYLEMPGLHLTMEQAERLWGLDASTCKALFNTLLDAQFLVRTEAGGYTRTAAGG